MKKNLLICFSLLFCISTIRAGGLKGLIKDKDGALAFVTLYVKEAGTGTTSNENGLYEINLPNGAYTLVFQLMGYETQIHHITIDSGFTVLDVIMTMQSNMLQEVTIVAGKEDPAYTIMRKAIAKAKYHTQQLNFYSARVYTKGTGKLKDYPWLLKGQMKKEGIDKDRVFISESVSDIEYKRPDTFKEKVISVRSDGNDNNTSPNGYIFGSFYSPEIAETISPLSPRAFSYYKFKYLGVFQDRNYTINKIQVTPRSKGDNVFEGVILILEDEWSIHSLDLTTSKMGISVQVKQIYAPIEDKVWQPVSHCFNIDGKVLGFEFEYKYLATISNYKIELNKELYIQKINLVDEKLDKKSAQEIKNNSGKGIQNIQNRLEEGKPVTRKELRKVIKEYEKKENETQEDKDVLSNYTYIQDSIKFQKDSTYWNSIRSVPLTEEEVKGYKKTDSLAVVERKKETADSVKQRKRKGFQPWDIITGDSYNTSKRSNFNIETPGGGFNTIEGLYFIYKLKFSTTMKDTNKTNFFVTPAFRYGITSRQLYSKITATLKNKKYDLIIEGGRYIKQFNSDEPILPFTNTLTTLLFEKNLMKIYQHDFIAARYTKTITPKISFNIKTEWTKRTTLQNNTNYKLIDYKNIEGYTSNNPANNEYGSEVYSVNSHALNASISLSAKPWLKYKIRNNIKKEIENSSPELSITYIKGINALKSDINYDFLETTITHALRFGVRGKLDLQFNAGIFINNKNLYFMDYKHFLGNQTFLITANPVKSFRLLDYYTYSTKDKYFSGNVYYQFRKLLLSHILYIRMIGIREALFVNYLATPTSKNYTELGYSIDGILRFFRIEATAAFQNGKFISYGLRIGIATSISSIFHND